MKSTTYIRSSIIFLVFFILSNHYLIGQEKEKKFLSHLYNTGQYEHLINYAEYVQDTLSDGSLADTLQYLLGKSYFQKKDFNNSIFSFQKLDPNFSNFSESKFLQSYSEVALGSYKNASLVLDEPLIKNDSIIKELRYFELSGIALLERNKEKYYAYNDSIDRVYYFFKKEHLSIKNTATQLFERKEKSPLVGALLTAVVPGAGRFYAGKRGQAIYSFIITSFLALQTYESYQKDGIESPRFIIYGSLLSAFHIGNIWGSALSVKNYRNEYNQAANYSIELDLLIPIRSFYK